VGRAGIEPASLATSRLHDLTDFEDYMRINMRLKPRTINDTIVTAKRYLDGAEGIVSKDTLKEYLEGYIDNSPWTYNSQIVRLNRLIKEYLNRPDIIEDFSLAPINTITKKKVPTLNQVRAGYEALDNEIFRTYYLVLATTGLRKGETLGLTKDKIYPETRAVIPEIYTRTKRSGISFYNHEAEDLLIPLMGKTQDGAIFKDISGRQHKKMWNTVSKGAGMRITAQVLRVWFSTELGERMIPDRYIDIFQGRAPRSTIGRYYTGRDLERLKRIYEKANLSILN
jgi:integrase